MADRMDDLEEQIDALERALGGAEAVASSFNGEMARMARTMAEAGTDARKLSGGISRGLSRAFDGLILDGGRLQDALRGVGRSIADTAYSEAMKPVSKGLGGLIAGGIASVMPFAKGGTISQGVRAFADGGVVDRPTTFPMRGGTGLMGEAGPEAILPLGRGPDGKLGVRAEGGRSAAPVVHIHIQTPDVEGFRRSQTQVAAEMRRALAKGDRNA